MYKKIIVPIEMGQIEKGEKILAKAVTLLDQGGEIILLNVAETIPSYIAVDMPVDFVELSARDADTKLAELKAKITVPSRIVVKIGSPAREIIDLANHEHADLIIIGSHRPDFTNYLIGATADRVVRHATCSVLVDR